MDNSSLASPHQALTESDGQHSSKHHLDLFSCSGVSQRSLLPLGNNAKSSDTFLAEKAEFKGLEAENEETLEVIDEDTGEVRTFKKFSWGTVEHQSPEQILTERFALQSAVRYLMPSSRTAKCTRLTTGAEIGMHKSKEHGTCSYGGLQTCGSVWACPVCAAKITTRRRNETREAMQAHLDQGGRLYFITYTFPHTNAESLSQLKGQFSEALKAFRTSYQYKQFKKLVGYDGLIRALEVTFGFANGWHPHTHEVVFANNKVPFKMIKHMLFQPWKNACIKAGLPAPSFRRGIDVKGGDKAADYLNKYGNELTMAHVKKARGDRYTPFDLLRAYLHENDKQFGAKFVEFAEAMKGARQLFWTKGLKAKFEIDDCTDEELAAKIEDDTQLLGKIPFDKWRAVVRYNARATLLILGQKQGFNKVEEVVEGLYLNYCSSGDKQRDDDKKKRYLERQREKDPMPKPKTKQELDEVYQQVQLALDGVDQANNETRKRVNQIKDYTMQWYQENMASLKNPYAN